MARSFWKPNTISKEFILSNSIDSILFSQQSAFKCSTLKSGSSIVLPVSDIPTALIRRNHILTKTQTSFLRENHLDTIYLYTGYDKLSVTLPVGNNPLSRFNVGQLVTTREVNVTHKAKLSKAARKNKAKLLKKKTIMTGGKQARITGAGNKRMLTKKIAK